MRPGKLALIVLVALALAGSALAVAKVKPPPTGPYKLGQAGTGFTLKHQGSKYLVTNLKFKTGPYGGCPEKPTIVRVLGKHPIKTFTRGGYTTWGLGKNNAGDVAPIGGRVSVGGKTMSGTFYLVWNYSNYRQILGGSVEAGGCLTQITFGSHK